jgi:hypothetical protein
MDGDEGSVTITIRPGSGLESVRVQVPGMPEFETGPDQLRDWVREHGFVRTPHQRTQFEQDLDRAIEEGRRRAQQQPQQQQPRRHGPGDGTYQWDDFATRHNQPGLTDPEREAVDEEQSAAWTRMLNAWEQFHQQVQDLHSIADGDSEQIVRQVGHTITALNMIENNDWAEPYTAEFSAWEMLSTDGVPPERMHAAAHAVVEAGQTLYNQWHAAIEAGNYSSYSLYDEQHEFIRHCAQARERLHQH